jgi:hypothetical protein
MGYSIYIGEALPCDCKEPDCWYEKKGMMLVEAAESREAPDGGGPIGHGNWRGPSYSAWPNFTTAVGLDDLFWDKRTGLMRSHPGTVPLKPEHLRAVQEARRKYKGTVHPDCLYPGEVSAENKARLEWLEFWMNWALKNCKRPTFHNS